MKTQPHFLQTSAWASFQQKLGRQTFTEHGKGWAYMAILERGRFGARLYCPYGPTADSRAALGDALASLKNLGRQHKAIFVRFEPVTPEKSLDIRALGAIPALREVQPQHTWRIDLSQSEDEIISQMNATNRNLHRTAGNKGITFSKSADPKDINKLLTFVHEVARRTGIRPHSDDYFRLQAETLLPAGAAHLFFAEYQGQVINAAFVYDSADTRYYAHAGGSFDHRKLHAGTPLVSHMMLDAKKSGLAAFDFYGIAPAGQANHPWAGFTKFKQSFGGHQHDFAGTWDIPLQRSTYRMIRLAQQAHGLKNKVMKKR